MSDNQRNIAQEPAQKLRKAQPAPIKNPAQAEKLALALRRNLQRRKQAQKADSDTSA